MELTMRVKHHLPNPLGQAVHVERYDFTPPYHLRVLGYRKHF
ncbi:MAG: hypothetical protein ACE5KV_08765 [Thermoplasmata archaeon]